MSFLEKVKQREAEKQRRQDEIQKKMPEWAQAVGQLCILIRKLVQPEVRRSGDNSAPRAQRGTCRVDGFQLETLKITDEPEGKNATVKPLSLSDPKAQGAVGCVLLEGQDQVYRLLWDGKSHAVPDHWQIVDSDGDTKALTEDTLDETLETIFGLREKAPKTPTRRIRFDE